MEELFEIPAASIRLENNIYTELGIDSIDTIDLMIALKPYAGKNISPEEFKHVRTISDMVDAVASFLD